jgi:anaerobic ribonucleoside-triphosphate reductase
MGSSGLFGFFYKGIYYLFYNHWDSYPGGLGKKLINEIKKAIKEDKLNEWKDKLLALKIVSDDINPTDEDIEKLKEYTDLTVSTRSTSDWYCLMRKCQGSYKKTLNAGYCIKNEEHSEKDLTNKFMACSFVLNFDTNKFEYYTNSGVHDEYAFDNLPEF